MYDIYTQPSTKRIDQQEILPKRKKIQQTTSVTLFTLANGSHAEKIAIMNTRHDLGLGIVVERGIPSKRNSSYCVDYASAHCILANSL